ncbi:probable RNA-directed DNA polymerase from transposon BS [Trichonephila inaurata madagascariensis]|uniref:Probable RNA-directed DNA polymerase from transposon BS n=1 Tax=Trichonephila inaurata madagascariensis TaxID=2747483 RepID=A0A8X6KFC1_9ARAC|nr:probable RNA-directed DNA polymerase from transposon BS [Trichonephila inaurata madagascariensis]
MKRSQFPNGAYVCQSVFTFRVDCHKWDRLFSAPFSDEEFQRALQKLSRGKSAGPEGILPEFILELGSKAKQTILLFINKTWGGSFPSYWRKADVLPILKPKKDPTDIQSFRPISLTSILSKLSERMIVDRLQYYMDNCDHISEKQAGFRWSYNMIEQIVRLTQHIKDGFQKKQSMLAVFVDFKLAFDRVWRKMLLKKLLHMNVSDHLFKWISDFLSQCFLNIKYGNSRSGYGQTRHGLPQGSVLSPILFNIMINDLLSFIANAEPEVNSLLYADDLVLWSTGSDIPKLESTLNSALVTLANWSLENDFKWGSSQSVLTSTFTSYIRPVIDYSSELLVTASDSALLKLDIVQNKALRFITGATTSTPIASMELQTEISSSSERHQYYALSLGERLMRKEHFWPKHIPSQTRLKTQHTFLFEFQRLANVLVFPIIDFPSLDRLPSRVI